MQDPFFQSTRIKASAIRKSAIRHLFQSLIVSNSCSSSILYAQLKCPNGQAFNPCNPQGRHASGSLISTIKLFSDKGPKPNEGSVEQYTAVTGALTAEAKCIGAESFT